MSFTDPLRTASPTGNGRGPEHVTLQDLSDRVSTSPTLLAVLVVMADI